MLRAELMAHPLESAALSRRTPISDFGQHLVAVAQSAKRLARLLLILAKFSKDGKHYCKDQPGNARGEE
jgi:hypothetical protein